METRTLTTTQTTNPDYTRIIASVLTALLLGAGLVMLLPPASAASFPVNANIQPSMNLTVTPNFTLNSWNLQKHTDNLMSNAFYVYLESDYPTTNLVINDTSSNPVKGYMYNASHSLSLTNPLHIGAPSLDLSPFTLDTITYAQSPYNHTFPLSQLLNGDKAGTYSTQITLTAVLP